MGQTIPALSGCANRHRSRPLVGRFAYLVEREVWTKPPFDEFAGSELSRHPACEASSQLPSVLTDMPSCQTALARPTDAVRAMAWALKSSV
jgi:hypothetical protein